MRIIIVTAALAALCACQPKTDEVPANRDLGSPQAAAAKPALDIAFLKERLAGHWQSIEDEKSTITVEAGGKWTSEYTDPPVNNVGAWKVFTSEAAPADAKQYTLEAGKAYLEVRDMDGAFFYELGDVDEDMLEMFYLGRGNRLAYKRMK
jgi:hypothetical protein